MSVDSRQSFVGEIVGRHGRKLRRYLAARVRNTAEVADLAQEVFLRLMRVNRHDMIRSPESYLFTIASHVLAQHHLHRSSEPESVDINDPVTEQNLVIETDHAVQIDLQRRAKEMETAIGQLPPNPQACLLLHCREGWTLDEIATRLGVSRSMVKKHIARALLHCRQQLKDPG
ncbi:MAG: RNA polymerase sigma factor [Gammaproteobacteria bacterium]